MDVGENVKGGRHNAKTTALANKLAQSDFMQGWLLDNQQAFVDTMNLIKDGAPVKWAELYMKAYQMGLVKEQNINININRQQDRENLQALIRTRITTPEFTQYEEVEKKELPVIELQEEPEIIKRDVIEEDF